MQHQVIWCAPLAAIAYVMPSLKRLSVNLMLHTQAVHPQREG
jgi:hypothetical protein